jgi:hypothetical protein
MKTDTPRTDDAVVGTNISSAVFDVVRADFARELERENAKLRDSLVTAEAWVARLREWADRVASENDLAPYNDKP